MNECGTKGRVRGQAARIAALEAELAKARGQLELVAGTMRALARKALHAQERRVVAEAKGNVRLAHDYHDEYLSAGLAAMYLAEDLGLGDDAPAPVPELRAWLEHGRQQKAAVAAIGAFVHGLSRAA